jgi:hypothetical protein
MNCANHPEANATAFCRECGQPMCPECQRPALGSVYCQTHVPAAAPVPLPVPATGPETGYAAFRQAPQSHPTAFAESPWSAAPPPAPTATADPHAHPGLALFLGFIPGVGAIYNGQYAKGLIHAVIFGLLISLLTSTHVGGSEPLLGIMVSAWVMYQAFEAYHTARKRRYGLAVEEFSSLFDVRTGSGKFPTGAIFLIGIGFVLLLDTTDIIRFDQFARFWPLSLILIGGYMLYTRMNPAATQESTSSPSSTNGETRQ